MDSILQKRIRETMEAKGTSGNEVARRVGGGLGIVRDILSGKVVDTQLTLGQFCRLFGFNYDEVILLTRQNPKILVRYDAEVVWYTADFPVSCQRRSQGYDSGMVRCNAGVEFAGRQRNLIYCSGRSACGHSSPIFRMSAWLAAKATIEFTCAEVNHAGNLKPKNLYPDQDKFTSKRSVLP